MIQPQPSRTVPCPACATLNRVAADRLGSGGRCGRCGHALFDGRPIELSAASFEAHAFRSDLPLLVDFWAAWCAPCRQMAPAFAAAAARLEPDLRLGKLDTEREPQLAARFAVRSLPTLAIFSRGRELARRTGAVPASAIISWAREVLQRQASGA